MTTITLAVLILALVLPIIHALEAFTDGTLVWDNDRYVGATLYDEVNTYCDNPTAYSNPTYG